MENAIGDPLGPMPKLLTKSWNQFMGVVREKRMMATTSATMNTSPPTIAKYPPGTLWKNLLSLWKMDAIFLGFADDF
jgi:hypothetical protein